MTRDELIDKSEKFIRWMDRQIDCVEVPNDLRSRLALGALAMVLEYQKAIVLLIARNLHGAAFALIRLIFEAYVRAIWLQRCASERELQKFQKDKVPKFAELVVAVEKIEAFEGAVFSRVKARGWTAMNGFTHTGYGQIVRQQTAETIEANYDEEEVLEALMFANGFGWMAAIAICDLGGRVSLANDVLNQVKEIFGELHIERVA